MLRKTSNSPSLTIGFVKIPKRSSCIVIQADMAVGLLRISAGTWGIITPSSEASARNAISASAKRTDVSTCQSQRMGSSSERRDCAAVTLATEEPRNKCRDRRLAATHHVDERLNHRGHQVN